MNPKQDNNFRKFEDDSELDNKNIQLNVNPKANSQVSSQEKKFQPAFLKRIVENKEDIAANMVARQHSNATEQVSNAIMDKINNNLQFIGKYFNVEADDIKQKLIASVNPTNKDFHKLAENNPDLYGPFWIYTTLIFLVAFSGNISNYISVNYLFI
jgi:hypothetical protein